MLQQHKFCSFGHRSLVLIFTLIVGLKYRFIILAYLRAPKTRMGPINYLIWLDQLNGLLLGVTIVYKLIALNCPVPMVTIFGSTFCDLVSLPGSMYLAGSYMWSSYIAIYRIIYVRYNQIFLRFGNEKCLLYVLMVLGFASIMTLSLLMLVFDHRKSSVKMCTHYSDQQILSYRLYNVSILRVILLKGLKSIGMSI